MKELLEWIAQGKDLMAEPRVVAAYWGLTGKTGKYKCIEGSIADVAFQMRDATLEYNWKRSLHDVVHYVNFHILKKTKITTDEATAKMWIWAAVLAYEAVARAGDEQK